MNAVFASVKEIYFAAMDASGLFTENALGFEVIKSSAAESGSVLSARLKIQLNLGRSMADTRARLIGFVFRTFCLP